MFRIPDFYMSARNPYLPYLALAAVCLLWGTTYLALRIAVLHFPPFLFSAIRQTVAGIILTGGMLIFAKAALPSKQQLLHQAIGGFLLMTLGNGLVAWGEVHVSSSMAAIICSLMPLVVILINLSINREEKPNMAIGMGVALGLAGIIMIFGENLSEFSTLAYTLGIFAIFIAVISWAGGSIWIKKHHANSDPFLNAGLQMLFGGLFMFPASFLFDDLRNVTWSPEAGWSLLYLIVFGSVIAYACYSYALRHLPMTIVSMYAYINPLVAVLLGWLVLDEKLTVRMGIAIIITVAGIYIVNRGYQLRSLWKAPSPK
ncbi:MAG TPA: EamA family transporter [Cyclobacteriaceae bacterium]|nr:EamA family transporter [Cyclobacteriaceae bacterium]